MSVWFVRVADHCGLSREIATIAVNFLDRFLVVHAEEFDQERDFCLSSIDVQMIGLGCISLAIKMHVGSTSHGFSLKHVSQTLTNGKIQVDEIKRMEEEIVSALDWRLNPPTPYAMLSLAIKYLSDIEPASLPFHLRPFLTTSGQIRHLIFDLAEDLLIIPATHSELVFSFLPSELTRAALLIVVSALYGSQPPAEVEASLFDALDAIAPGKTDTIQVARAQECFRKIKFRDASLEETLGRSIRSFLGIDGSKRIQAQDAERASPTCVRQFVHHVGADDTLMVQRPMKRPKI
jgi:hypothetical protein